MKMYLCAIFDQQSGQYQAPVMVAAPGVAMRFFADQVNATDGNVFAAHPEDFVLRELGQFDLEDGVITQDGLDHPDVCRLVSLKR